MVASEVRPLLVLVFVFAFAALVAPVSGYSRGGAVRPSNISRRRLLQRWTTAAVTYATGSATQGAYAYGEFEGNKGAKGKTKPPSAELDLGAMLKDPPAASGGGKKKKTR